MHVGDAREPLGERRARGDPPRSRAMSFAMHKQVHPPTGVDHACAAYFTHPIGDGGPPNLVVTQANHLTVFAIRRESGRDNATLAAAAVAQAKGGAPWGKGEKAAADADAGATAASARNEQVSLEVVAEFDLHGTVGSIAVLRRRFGAPRNQRDALLIAIRECKLSVVEFDPATLSIVSSSLHSWETPTGSCGVPSALRVATLPPLAVSDPEGRCAAVLLPSEGKSRLALLPAVEGESFGDEEDEEDEEEDDDPDAPGASRTQSEIRARGTAASVRESYVVDLTERLGLHAVRDVAFLHGYGEPTILILHERAPTWAARVSLVADTCAVSAVSLDLDKRRHTVIWSREQLPHTCYRLCAVPDPLGGALVLSQNFISHESQESSRALALNPLAGGDAGDPAARAAAEAAARAAAEATTAGNIGAQDPSLANPPSALSRREGTESALGVSVELDSAHAAVLSERQVLLTTKAGALMLLSLRVEGRRLARTGAMTLRRAGGAVLSSGMCLVTRSLVFLGSRVGDSLLVSLAEKEAATETGMLPEAKRRKGDAGAAVLPPPPAPGISASGGHASKADDDDELEAMLYGEGEGGGAGKAAERGDAGASGGVSAEGIDGVGSVGADALRAAAAAQRAASRGREDPGYAFTVRDSVLGISPVIDLTVGASASVAGDVEERSELVAACGHGKNGALAILQRGIQPELVTEVESGTLPGLRGTWTVHHESRDNQRLGSSAAAAAAEAMEPFHSYLVISLEKTTMILETGEELREVSEAVELVTDAPTLAAGNVFGRARVAQVHAGGVRLAEGPVRTQDVSVADMRSSADAGGDAPANALEIVSAQVMDPYVLCRLSDGSVRVLRGDADDPSRELTPLDPDAVGKLPAGDSVSCACLFDDSVAAANHPGLDARAPGFLVRASAGSEAARRDAGDDGTALIVVRAGGALEVYALPSCERVWAADGLSDGARVLAPAGSRAARDNARVAADHSADASPAPDIVELRVDAFAVAHERPLLTALRGDGTVLVYRAFLCPSGAGGVPHAAPPQLRFARVPIELEGGGYGSVREDALPGSRLTRFERVGDRGGIRGVFVAGPKPLWLVARRSRVLALPMRGEARRVVSFTCFHNVNCPSGFILGTAAGGVRICQIPGRMHYEAAWPVRKLALKCTPHHVQYLPDFRLYALCTSAPVKFRETDVAADEHHQQTLFKFRRAKAMARGGVEEQFALRLLVPGSLECAWQHVIDPGEHVQSIRNVQLRNTRTGALQSMLAVGTAMPGGEDTPCRGRMLLFEVVWQMTDEGTKWQGRIACVRDAKMACTALSGLEGHLVVAIGTKLIVHSWDGEQLLPVAFYDTPLHTVTINVVKNFILLGDLHKGAYFFRWKDTPHEKLLVQLAKDFEAMDVLATEFLVDGSTLSLLATDITGNAFVFAYDPKSVESWKGQKLLTKAAFHVGSRVHRMVRFRLKPPSGDSAPKTPAEQKAAANRHAVFFGTLDGGMGILVPVEEQIHSRLLTLQRHLNTSTPRPAGLNARTFRQAKTDEGRAMRAPAPHQVLDGELLSAFEHLPWRAQANAAAAAGMSRDQALQYLHQISERTAFM